MGFFDSFVEQGSSWQLNKVLSIRLKVARFKPFRGACRETNSLPFCSVKVHAFPLIVLITFVLHMRI